MALHSTPIKQQQQQQQQQLACLTPVMMAKAKQSTASDSVR
jgi:hypothetical protein